MKIEDKLLFKISLITFVIGLTLLYIVMSVQQSNIENKKTIVDKIEQKQNTFVKISGIVKTISKYNTSIYFVLYDRDNKKFYNIILYKKKQEQIDLNKDDNLIVYGYTKIKNNKTYVIASKIIKQND